MKTKIPSLGISVIYFDNENKNTHLIMPFDKEYAKRLSRRIFKDAMTALSETYAVTDSGSST